MNEEEWHRRAVKCRSQAAAMLDGSEVSRDAVVDAWNDIHMAEVDRRMAELPTSDMRDHAARIVSAIDHLPSLDPHQYDFGSPMFGLLLSAPKEELSLLRERANELAEGRSPRRGNVDASRKRSAAEHAVRLYAAFPPKGRVLDKQRAELAALLVGEPEANMAPYITDAKKHPRK